MYLITNYKMPGKRSASSASSAKKPRLATKYILFCSCTHVYPSFPWMSGVFKPTKTNAEELKAQILRGYKRYWKDIKKSDEDGEKFFNIFDRFTVVPANRANFISNTIDCNTQVMKGCYEFNTLEKLNEWMKSQM